LVVGASLASGRFSGLGAFLWPRGVFPEPGGFTLRLGGFTLRLGGDEVETTVAAVVI
jgi:hypothetical protein